MRHTRRPHRDRIGYITIAAVLLATTLGCVAEGGRRQTIHHPVLRGYDPAIEPYVAFLQRQSTAPADYILGLFEGYDIVILCERMHSETTQWDMIYELTSDARFIDEVGVIFTEYGTVTLQPLLDEFLMAPDLSPEQAKQKLLHIARNLTPWWPIQLNRNFYDYLAKLRTLNGTLPQDKKIRLYFCDVPWDWNTTTTETLLQAWREVVKRRDLIMAQRVIEERRRRLAAGERNKCLVIMNYRHAFRRMDNTGRYIFEAFPGEVANVFINTLAPVAARSDRDISFDVIQDGKWDAAFESIGNPALGFDFQDSPFGNDSFDLFPFDPAAVAALRIALRRGSRASSTRRLSRKSAGDSGWPKALSSPNAIPRLGLKPPSRGLSGRASRWGRYRAAGMSTGSTRARRSRVGLPTTTRKQRMSSLLHG